MNGNRIFVDTNILLYFLKGEKEIIELLRDKQIVASFITELELLAFPGLSVRSEKNIKGLLSSCTIIDIDRDIKKKTIQIRKSFKLNLPIITADQAFGKINSLEVIIYEC